MLKLSGSFLFIILSVLIGRLLSENLKSRINAIDILIRFVEEISDEVKAYKRPLPEIYKEMAERGAYPQNFISSLDKGIYASAENSKLLFGEEEKHIIGKFSNQLGEGYQSDTVKLCDITADKLKRISAELKNEYPEKSRLCKSISFLAGLSIVILIV